jgi:hypothetical protein
VPPIATSYPAWFVLLAWAIILIPIYPGLCVLMIGALMKRAKHAAANRTLLVGIIVLAAGGAFMWFNWGSATSGNPYHLFGR